MCAQTADPPPGPSGREAASAALDAFLLVQQRRAKLYSRFGEAHKLFIRTRAEGPFKWVAQGRGFGGWGIAPP